jgi:hypothetical protein
MTLVIFNQDKSGEFCNGEIRVKLGTACVSEFCQNLVPVKSCKRRIPDDRTENRDWWLELRRLRRVRITKLRELGKIAP